MPSSSEKSKRSLHIELTLGRPSFTTVTYLLNTPISSPLFVSVLMLEFVLFTIPMLHLIVLLYIYTLKLTATWSLMSSKKADTSVHAHEVEALIDPFQSSPLSWVPKAGKPGKYCAVHNFSFSRTLPLMSPPLIAPLTQTCTPVHGAPLTPSASPSSTSLLDLKQPFATLLRPTAQFPLLLNNGQAWLSSYSKKTSSPSTRATILVFPQLGAFTEALVTQHLTSFVLRALGLAQSGSMTTFFSGSFVSSVSLFLVPITYPLVGEHLASYNLMCQRWHGTIMLNGGSHQSGSRFWYQGESMPDDSPAEFDEDAACPLADYSALPDRSGIDSLFTYCDTDIDNISGQLGIPWEPSKTVPFSSMVTYLGFDWNLEKRTVAITERKKAKYRAAINEWLPRPTPDLEEVQKLYGKLLHASLVLPAGRAYLTSLESLMASFSGNPFVPHHAPRHTAADLSWWLNVFDSPRISQSIPGPAIVMDRNAFSDASSGFGIGIVISNKWRAWQLVPSWKTDGRDIGWAEAVGFELLARALCTTAKPGQHFRVFGDNKGVVKGWWKGRSRNWETNKVFRRIHDLADAHQCLFITRYVASRENPADGRTLPSNCSSPPRNQHSTRSPAIYC